MLVCGTVLGLAGTDLVLPAIPALPNSLAGNIEQAQLVLAAYAGGSGLGLLFFGELGARYDQRRLLMFSLAGFACLSLLATVTTSILQLVSVRLLQGFAGSAAAVFAPGMIRKMFDEPGALRALGLMGSVESMVPALAPIFGAWLLIYFDWQISFVIIGTLSAALAVICLFLPGVLPNVRSTQSSQGYSALLKNRSFQNYALSQAFTLGGLLVFVFGAPTVITLYMGGSLSDFVVMQVIGIFFFVVSANLAPRSVASFGAQRMILLGSVMSAIGFSSIFAYAVLTTTSVGEQNPRILWLLFAIGNLGLGLRGPPGFYNAVLAAGDNDARGAALMLLCTLMTAALGTAAVAPFIELGLIPLSLAAMLVSWASVALVVRQQTTMHE